MFYTTMLLDQSGWGNHTHMLRPIFQCQLKQENHPGKIYWNLFEVLKEYFKTDILCFVCMYILCAEHVPRELKGTIQLQFVNCWNLNVGTLGEQQVLLTSTPSPLQTPQLPRSPQSFLRGLRVWGEGKVPPTLIANHKRSDWWPRA